LTNDTVITSNDVVTFLQHRGWWSRQNINRMSDCSS